MLVNRVHFAAQSAWNIHRAFLFYTYSVVIHRLSLLSVDFFSSKHFFCCVGISLDVDFTQGGSEPLSSLKRLLLLGISLTFCGGIF